MALLAVLPFPLLFGAAKRYVKRELKRLIYPSCPGLDSRGDLKAAVKVWGPNRAVERLISYVPGRTAASLAVIATRVRLFAELN